MRFINGYLNISKKLNKLLEYICAILIILMTLIIWVQVFNRYFLGSSFVWVEDITKMLMVYMAMLGAAILVFEDGHVTITILRDKLKYKNILKLIFLLMIIAFSALLVYSGIIFVVQTRRTSWMTGLHYRYYHFSMVIGGVFILNQSIAQSLKLIKEIFMEEDYK